jgi:hypothetical protein
MPNGCDANGRLMLRTTSRVLESMTLIVALCLLVTQTSPLGAIAKVRGAVAYRDLRDSRVRTRVDTLTESLSWFTTHSRSLPVGAVLNAEIAGYRRAIRSQWQDARSQRQS